MTPLEAAYIQLTDTELDMMIVSAWREAARDWMDARNACRDHGAGHTQLCLMLTNTAQSSEQHWRNLFDERRRRGKAPLHSFDPRDNVDLFSSVVPHEVARDD